MQNVRRITLAVATVLVVWFGLSRRPRAVDACTTGTVTGNSYDGPQWWGTITFRNDGPTSLTSYKVEFDVPAGSHCTAEPEAIPPGATLSPLTGSNPAHTVSNHCVFTWVNGAPVSVNGSTTFNYSTDTQNFSTASNVTVSDMLCNGRSASALTVATNSYDGPNWWGTFAFKNKGPLPVSNFSVEFDVPSGGHCTAEPESVPPGAILSPLTGANPAHTVSNHCAFTWINAAPVQPGSTLTFNYSTDMQGFNSVGGVRLVDNLAGLPAVTVGWPASPAPGPQDLTKDAGLFPDAQVAVGRSSVLVTQRDHVALFDRNGNQTAIIKGDDFFSGFKAMGCGDYCTFDFRTVYDEFRDRFWVVGLSRAIPDDNSLILIAVSTTGNPTDLSPNSWYRYNWNAQVGGSTGEIDYPSIAITSDALVETHGIEGAGTAIRVFPAAQMAAGTPANMLTGTFAWAGQSIKKGDGMSFGLYQPAMNHNPNDSTVWVVVRYGTQTSPTNGGCSTCSFPKPAGESTAGVTLLKITNPLQNNRSIQTLNLNKMVDGKTVDLLHTFYFASYAGPNGYANWAPQYGTTWKIGMYINSDQPVLKAIVRGSKLFFVTPDARTCGSPAGLYAAARLVRLDVSNFPALPAVEVDRTFGCASPRDPANTFFHYGWPGLEVTPNLDAGILTLRTGPTTLPQLQYNVYRMGDSDIRPSLPFYTAPNAYSLADAPGFQDEGGKGNGGLSQHDVTGASVDPTDPTSIWFSQVLPDNRMARYTNQRIGRVYLGKCSHDLCTSGVPLTSSCDSCAAQVCAANNQCCSTRWDSTCISAATSLCGRPCP